MDTFTSNYGEQRNLNSFEVAQLVYDVTVRFYDCFIKKRNCIHDHMMRVVRPAVQDKNQSSQSRGISIKNELKLASVARTCLEELRFDYEDFCVNVVF